MKNLFFLEKDYDSIKCKNIPEKKETTMKVKVTIEAKQIFNGQEQTETNHCEGEMQNLEKGTILDFVERQPNQDPITFHMVVREERILLERQGQRMIFDKTQDSKLQYQTPCGEIEMKLHTKQMRIEKQMIQLTYDLTLENQESYENRVKISIQEI